MPRTKHVADHRTPAVTPDRILGAVPLRVDLHSALMRRELSQRRLQIERAMQAARQWRPRQSG